MATEHTLAFKVDDDHFARQISLDDDLSAVAGLGKRSVDYLRLFSERHIGSDEASSLLPKLLQSSSIPAERNYVFGIYFEPSSPIPQAERLKGVLRFLHPYPNYSTWFITLFLLEPMARGKGLGSAVHHAFEQWAAKRGADRFVVAVVQNNPRALHFWRDRLGYRPTLTGPVWRSEAECNNQELERRLHPSLFFVPSKRRK